MTTVPLTAAVLFSLATVIFSVGCFYALTNYRLKRMEDEIKSLAEDKADTRERLVRIETLLNEKKTA